MTTCRSRTARSTAKSSARSGPFLQLIEQPQTAVGYPAENSHTASCSSGVFQSVSSRQECSCSRQILFHRFAAFPRLVGNALNQHHVTSLCAATSGAYPRLTESPVYSVWRRLEP